MSVVGLRITACGRYMFALSIMAFDRLVTIRYPFQYHSYLINMRTLVLAYLLCIIACCFAAVLPANV